MRKFEDWFNSIPLTGTVATAFLTGTLYGREFDISWETLAAGFLGLTGGWLAYKAATDHRRATENRNEYIFRARHLPDLHRARELLERHRPLGQNFPMLVIGDYNPNGIIELLDGAACFDKPLPARLANEIESLCLALPAFKTSLDGTSTKPHNSGATSVEIKDTASMVRSFWRLKGATDELIQNITFDALR
ncbi:MULTISPECIES: hypothetical protein [Thalassospira]|uniref:Uncharacterized protein n=1 Tax=Thalassospira profundimaris TaxID=502049 RepID=A0A367V7A6_9PROT|nr:MULTISPECIES: hypothetical protein [Thalassospira]KZB73267.1 hypothetical protein AUQ43_18495 [Thalassospira sp. MCCC 1A01148]RCK21088.1 hypothetical protein TH6_15095 [Thalassospira profundimaris]